MSQRRGHVEVVGGGLAGLLAGAALAQRGWSVTIHEKAPELRMFGAGIWLWENGLGALEAVGAFDGATYRGQRMIAWEITDNRGAVVRRRPAAPDDRLIVPPRADLYDALIESATAAGAKIITSSKVRAATPDGRLILEDGSERTADLVVAADGIRSQVRESLGLTKSFQSLGNGAVRMLIPRTDEDPGNVAAEHWSGNRVILYHPCSPEYVYLCLVCPLNDERGRQVPLDKETWAESFPRLSSVLARVEDQGRWDDFETVTATRWSKGHVGVIGDAAHGQPPWLGQAANLAFANSLALAEFVTYAGVASGLESWERRCRPVTDHTERWTNAYGRIVNFWPPHRQGLRSLSAQAFCRLPLVERKLNLAQHTTLVGTNRGSQVAQAACQRTSTTETYGRASSIPYGSAEDNREWKNRL